ncbi:uncharacterized protein E0L32_007269 [Thyridium curvatum]|uniref:ABC transporter domain-containing protein n=1 Tax=Thyridium curvatum TaxID=1093900 RepID=A0A507AYV3_9PEZI|nr:uncharacterized protein E0L32_007269 [Thyridium curvatum]TPX11966.1 hypothetical protein E0L32_007269 [Thyridium curvatum]
MAADSAATIVVSCKQTRFHIANADERELNIDGLNITVVSGDQQQGTTAKPKGKAKSKAKADGNEILVDANLRLKAGQRYALVGRNGTGKSTLLRAISDKLIPGIPEETRISILQQTSTEDVTDEVGASEIAQDSTQGVTVLEQVIGKATAKDELQREIDILAKGIGNTADSLGALRALRQVQHDRLEKQHFILDKNYRLRSGDRGLQAKKALTAFEKTLAVENNRFAEKDEDISAETLEKETQEAVDMLAELQLQVEPSRLAETESRAKKILAGLGFSEAYMNKTVSSLSGGWQMRTSLATVLLSETDILILDEPTNFLDLMGIIWLERYLRSLEDLPDAPTLILVSHDRDFISLCTDLLILKEKSLTYYHGDLPSYEAAAAEKKQHLTKVKEAQDKQRAHIQETISRNMREGKKNNDENRIRQAKSRQKKLDDRWGLQTNEKGHRFKLNRDLAGFHLTARAELEVPPEERAVAIALPDPPDLRFPGALISVEGAVFRYPRTQVDVLRGVDLSVAMGDRVGILGLNGAGKSTLVRLLVGETQPTRGPGGGGAVQHHPRLRLGYYSQHAVPALLATGRADPGLTALSLLMREVDAELLGEGDVRALLASLGLAGRTASDVPLARLSGGQLARCELARILWRRPQCLVLDEVTTHLDYETVGALRSALASWDGAVVLVSHDRWFVRGVVEGIVDDENVLEDDEDADEDDAGAGGAGVSRRRTVYSLRNGKLHLLGGGVQDFETSMEKKVKKLLKD